ncbi:MAG: hypothetical protein JWR21_425 [Herminiimonas sp.]|nr:hypothetical protein [Herminiimonas sp.]
MTENQRPSLFKRRAAACWRTGLHGYRVANRVTHHALGFLLVGVAILYFVFCATVLLLRYAVLPNIDRFKPQVEQLASRALGQPVGINTITASWRGLQPRLTLTDVVIRDRNGAPALKLPRVSATLSWWSVPVGDLRLQSLEIDRPDMEIERDAKGNVYVAGIQVNARSPSDGRGLDWVLSQREIVIRDGGLRWKDGLRGAPELELRQVNLVLENQWVRHRVALTAVPPAGFGSPLDVRADFDHPAFAAKISDTSQWIGTLYADWHDTDLALWKKWIDYPIEVQSGKGSVRAWLSVDHWRVVDLTADLMLADLESRLRKDLQPLQLAQVKGRVSAREEIAKKSASTISFGEVGHTVALQDFSLETRDGLKLPLTSIRESWTAARADQPEKAEIQATALDLKTISDFAAHLPLSESQRGMLKDFSPRGELKDFSAKWTGAWPRVASYAVKGSFAGLSLRAQAPQAARPKDGKTPAQRAVPGIPGFENLTGSVEANEQGGSVTLASSKATVNLPGYFAESDLPFEQLDMEAKWRFQGDNRLQFDIARMNFAQEGIHGSLSSKYSTVIQDGGVKSPGDLALIANIAEFDINRIGRYLPSHTPDKLRAWLAGALVGGKARDVTVSIKGNLANFPFRTERASDKPKGEFKVSGTILDGTLDYAPGHLAADGKSPLWPEIGKIRGQLTLDRTHLKIHADSAETHKVALSDVDVTLPDLLSPDMQVEASGKGVGPLQEYAGFVNDSPVGEWIAHFTDETKASGNAGLTLKLQLPIVRLRESKVQGALQFSGNELVLMSTLPPLSQVGGELRFQEKGFELAAIKAGFLGGPVTVSGGMQRDGVIAVRAEGLATTEGLRRTYTSPATQRLFQRITGSARYTALIGVKNKRPDINVDSNLQGLALDFPSPLSKGASETLPLKFELTGAPAEEGFQRDEIRMTLGTISARYSRRKAAGRNASWEVASGGIGVNVPAPQPDSGLNANVSLRSLDIDAWRSTVAAIVGPREPAVTGSSAPSAPLVARPAPNAASNANPARAQSAAGATANRNAVAANRPAAPVVPAAPPATGLGIAQYIDPEVLAARAGELIVMGKRLDNVVVGASHQKGVWQANIDSAQASGHVTWNESVSGRGLGRVTARLATLVIPQAATSDVSDLLEGKSATTQIPALDIVADSFELAGKKLGRLELQANNAAATVGTGREWRINKLLLANTDGTLTATGKWVRGADNLTSLAYSMEIANAGTLLERLGFANVLRGGQGRMEGEVTWKGLPFSLDIPSLTGTVRLDMAAGQFLKVDPGAAKLLGVLSLQSLPRRLTLDFRDVFSEGFAFDGVVGSAEIDHGIMRTDNFKMRSVNAAVLMDGKVDIAKESQDLHVVVIPEINAGTASVVYGLIVNPVIGLGSFLAQLFLRDPLMKAFTMEYQIDGPWKNPNIKKLSRGNGNAENPASQGAPTPVS